MNVDKMIKCYDNLINYRKDELNRSAYFRDKDIGTKVDYYINDYKVSCYFFRISPNDYELSINASLKTDWSQRFFNNSISFIESDMNEIYKVIDDLIKACLNMPQVYTLLKIQMQKELDDLHSTLDLYN